SLPKIYQSTGIMWPECYPGKLFSADSPRLKFDSGDPCTHQYRQQDRESQNLGPIHAMAVKANKDLPQNKRNADFCQHPQADAMELQIVREGAEQFDQNKD